jgi:hypothetical protein
MKPNVSSASKNTSKECNARRYYLHYMARKHGRRIMRHFKISVREKTIYMDHRPQQRQLKKYVNLLCREYQYVIQLVV